LLALFFIVQYHCRMSFLSLRYKLRAIPRTEITPQAHNHWNKLCQALTVHKALTTTLRTTQEKLESEQLTGSLQAIKKHVESNEQVTGVLRVLKKTVEHEGEQLTGALQAIKRTAESERLHAALHTAKERLEAIVFVEEPPTQPLDLAALEKLKTAWHSLETGKIPRITPEALKAARHPLQTFKSARHKTVTLITLGLTALLLVALFAASGMASRTLHAVKTDGVSGIAQLVSSELDISAQQAPAINASRALMRVSQLEQNEYASQDQYNTWAYSACSTASMTEVFNAYGHHYRIADVLKVEAAIGAITPQLGLLRNSDVARTAAQFGFQTNWGNDWTLNQVFSYANAGQPVIVGWPPDRYDQGHIVVVIGGDAASVYLADSSLWNRHAISHAQFMQWWGGFAAVVTPE
jgi:hypothetical protein